MKIQFTHRRSSLHYLVSVVMWYIVGSRRRTHKETAILPGDSQTPTHPDDDGIHTTDVCALRQSTLTQLSLPRLSLEPLSVISGVGMTTVSSLTFEHLFTWAGANCYSYTGAGGDGLQACQVREVLF